jgi:O-antigen ligase/Tfp pilus assembly protein PilF
MRSPSCQDGTLRGYLPTAADFARGVLLVHLVLSPLVFSRFTTEAFESNKVALLILTAITLTGIGLWTGAAWLLATPREERRALLRRQLGEGLRDPLALGFLLFAASAVVSTVASISPWTSLLGTQESCAGLGTLLSYVVLFFATRALCRGPGDAGRFLAPAVVAAAVVAAYAVLQFAHLDPMRWEEVSIFAEHARPFAMLGHANMLAAYVVTVLPIVVAGAARAGSTRSFGSLAVLAVVVALGLTAVLLALSRGAWLALACAGIFLPILAWRAGRRRDVLRAGAVLLAAAACAAIWLGVSGRSDLWRSTAERVRHLVDDPARREIWAGGLAIFRDHPLTGCGLDTFHLAFESKRSVTFWHLEWNTTPVRAHNELLQVLATQGALGGLALLLILVGLGRAAVRAGRAAPVGSRGLVAAACASVLAFCVQDLFNFTLAPAGTLFVTLAAIVSAFGRTEFRVPSTQCPVPAAPRALAILLGVAALAGVLLFAVNMTEGSGRGWACCALLAAVAVGVAWAVGRIENPSETKRDGLKIRPTATLWGVRAAIVAVTIFVAVQVVVEPFQASLACRAGDLTLTAGESAVDDYQQAAALAPHQVVCWMKLAGASQAAARSAATPAERVRLFHLGRQATEEAVRLEPTSASAHLNHGTLLAEMATQGLADTDEALAELDRATAADPNNAWLLATAGQSALMLRRMAKAEDYFTRGLAIDPDYARLRAGFGAVALVEQHYGEARKWLEEAYAADWHGDQEAWFNGVQGLALAYLATGDLAHCEELATSAVSIWPDRPEPRLILARVLEVRGRAAPALAEYRQALALAPQNAAASNGVRRLEPVVRGEAARATAAGSPPR